MMNGWEESEGELALVTTAIRATVTRLLRENEISPRLVARLLARVAGELGAEASLAVGTEVETSLDVLAEALRRAGADRHVAPRPDLDRVAGNA